MDCDDRDDEGDGRVGPPEAEDGVGAEAAEDREREVNAEDVLGAFACGGGGLELFTGAAAIGPTPPLSELAISVCANLLWLEDYDAARVRLSHLIAAARAREARSKLARLLDTLAALDSRLGRWLDASAETTEALELIRATDDHHQLASKLTTLARIEALRDLEVDCRAHAQEALALETAAYWGRADVWARAALGLLELGRGDVAAAVREFDALVALSATQPALVRPGEAIWHADCIEAWIRSGRVDAARALLDSFAAVAATSGLNWASASAAPCRGLLAADDAFEQHFAEAFAYHEHDRWPFERARTALCLGERGRRARRPRDARSPLHEALAAFEQLGAPQWAERARAEVRRTGERVSRREGGKAKLTSRELEVARLVGDELATTPSASLK